MLWVYEETIVILIEVNQGHICRKSEIELRLERLYSTLMNNWKMKQAFKEGTF